MATFNPSPWILPALPVAVVCWALLLSACGFALRGSDAIAIRYPAIMLDLQQPNSELARLLRHALKVANVSVDPADGVAPVLGVRNELTTSRPVSINPRARAAQYQLRLSVEVALLQGETELLPPVTLWVERSYFEDIANIAGNQDEVVTITTEMRRDLVHQLLLRLRAADS